MDTADLVSKAKRTTAVVPKRSHMKSRLGCTSCKLRKVKCDESRPVCRSCRIRQTTCEYAPTGLRRDAFPETPTVPATQSSSKSNTPRITNITDSPSLSPVPVDNIDMKLLWFYTSATYKSLSYLDDKQSPMNDMLQNIVVQHALESSFLMDTILELASLHMQSLFRSQEPTRALVYRARSLKGYRKAIEDACPTTFGALLANSILRPLLCTQFFRDANSKNVYILDWMCLWQGVRSIIQMTDVSSITNSGMKPLFSRPRMNLDDSISFIPKELLLMVSFIDRSDDDAGEMRTYQDSLRALGWLCQNLKKGIDSIMLLRIVTWSTAVPPRLVELAKAGRPRALIIICHYAAFLKLLQDIWWLAGVGDRSIMDISRVIGTEWHGFVKIPLSVLGVEKTSGLLDMILESNDGP